MRENPTQKTAQNPAEKAAQKAAKTTPKTTTAVCAICARVATARDWHKHMAQISVPIIIGTLPDLADIIGTMKTLAKWAFRALLCQCANEFPHLHAIGKKIHKKIYIGGETRARARGTSRFDGSKADHETRAEIAAKICPKFCARTAAEITAPNRTANAAEIVAESSAPHRVAFVAFAELSTTPQGWTPAPPTPPNRAARVERREGAYKLTHGETGRALLRAAKRAHGPTASAWRGVTRGGEGVGWVLRQPLPRPRLPTEKVAKTF